MTEIINNGTFIVVVITFLITLNNAYNNRASIEIRQLPGSKSALIQPDFIDTDTPDVYWQDKYRVLIDVVIINQSAQPISIIEFVLNDKVNFNSYSLPGSQYTVTVSPEKETENGLTFHGSKRSKTYLINDSWLQPLFDIPPYTSTRGFLFFHLPKEDLVDIGHNKLQIFTSRKTFIKDLEIYELEKSRLQLPDDIHKAHALFDSQNPF